MLASLRVGVKMVEPIHPSGICYIVLTCVKEFFSFALEELAPGPTDYSVVEPHCVLGACVAKFFDGLLHTSVEPNVSSIIIWLRPH